jgi:hypothetical protein
VSEDWEAEDDDFKYELYSEVDALQVKLAEKHRQDKLQRMAVHILNNPQALAKLRAWHNEQTAEPADEAF